MFLSVPLQVILAITSTSETVIPTNHKICIFFSLLFIFLNQWCCCFLQFINICWASLWHLTVPLSNFPLHLHTRFLICTDHKILPSQSVQKWCLILVLLEVYPWISPSFSWRIFCHVMGLDQVPTCFWIIIEFIDYV